MPEGLDTSTETNESMTLDQILPCQLVQGSRVRITTEDGDIFDLRLLNDSERIKIIEDGKEDYLRDKSVVITNFRSSKEDMIWGFPEGGFVVGEPLELVQIRGVYSSIGTLPIAKIEGFGIAEDILTPEILNIRDKYFDHDACSAFLNEPDVLSKSLNAQTILGGLRNPNVLTNTTSIGMMMILLARKDRIEKWFNNIREVQAISTLLEDYLKNRSLDAGHYFLPYEETFNFEGQKYKITFHISLVNGRPLRFHIDPTDEEPVDEEVPKGLCYTILARLKRLKIPRFEK